MLVTKTWAMLSSVNFTPLEDAWDLMRFASTCIIDFEFAFWSLSIAVVMGKGLWARDKRPRSKRGSAPLRLHLLTQPHISLPFYLIGHGRLWNFAGGSRETVRSLLCA